MGEDSLEAFLSTCERVDTFFAKDMAPLYANYKDEY